jgi:hypothetical protein
LNLGSNFFKEKKTKCQSQINSPWSKTHFLGKKATSLGNNEFPWGRAQVLRGERHFIRGNNVLSPRRRAPSLWNNVLPLRKGLSSLRKKGSFLWEQWIFLGKRPQFLQETYVLNVFCNHNHFMFGFI